MSARAWGAFGTVSVLWGIPYLFIKIAIDDGMPPAFLAWARVLLAAVVLAAISARAGALTGMLARWRAVLAYGIVEVAIPFPMIAAGEQHVSSSLAAILIATVPLIIAVLALRFDPEERAHGRRLLGLFVGFAGVVALVGIDIAGSSDELLGAGFVLIAACGYAIGPMVYKRGLSDADPRAAMAASLTVAAVVLTPFALADVPDTTPQIGTFGALAILGLLCTATAFVAFGMLNNEVGPARASVITYVAPLIALAGGIIALGERPGPGAILGFALILTGSWLSTRSSSAPPKTSDEAVART